MAASKKNARRRDGAIRVFLSSTYLDNAERRKLILEVLHRFEMIPIAMERFEASSDPAPKFCTDAAGQADLYLGILAWRYGWIPPGETQSITELEYDAATCARLMFVKAGTNVDVARDVDQGPNGLPDFEKWTKLEAFKRRAQLDQMPAMFDGDSDLVIKVEHSIRKWLEQSRKPGSRPRGASELKRAKKPTQFETDVARYLDAVREENAKMRVIGFDTRMTVPIGIEALYVALHANVDRRLTRRGTIANRNHAEEEMQHSDLRSEVKLIELFARRHEFHDPRGFVILGEPGSGKTTHLKRVAFAIAKHGAASLGLPAQTLPVFLPLRAIAGEKDLLAFARQQILEVDPDASDAFLKHLLTRRHLLLLCDGLDEVPAKKRAEVRSWISRAARKRNITVLATCRYAGYVDDSRFEGDFLELHLRPLNDDEVKQFVQNWFEQVETTYAPDLKKAKKQARKDADALVAKILGPDFRTSRIYEFTRNPLLLTAICLLQRERKIPERRIEIYEECVKSLLQLWHEAAGLKVQFKADEAQVILQKVALALHERGEVLATAETLTPVVEPALASTKRKNVSAPQFLATIRDESGLLTGWSHDRFGFMHLGFQEYLTALELRERILEAKDPKERLARVRAITQHFGKSWWQESLLLMLAAKGPSLFGELFDEIVKLDTFAQNDQLIDYCLADALKVTYKPFESVLEDAMNRKAKKLDAIGQAAARVLRAKAPDLWEKFAKHFEASAVSTPRVFRASQAEIEFVNIPGGSFWMGADPKIDGDEHFMKDAKPLHRVTHSPFAMSRTPITNSQYKLFLEANPKHALPQFWSDRQYNQPEQPVVGVSWDDAMAFCEWAKVKLPTEAQWEYACRAQVDADKSARTRFWCGDESKLVEIAWYDENSEDRLHAVAEKLANAFGLCDMYGNVDEWCADFWAADYTGRETVNPAGPTVGSSRVIRGGSFRIVADGCRSAFRDWRSADVRWSDLGFRVVLPAPAP